MIFTYWMSATLDEPPSAAIWREKYRNFKVFNDSDVLPLLGSDLRRRIFSEINLPACKSDIARLILLREYGGLYVDAHTGPSDSERLVETLEALASYELVVFCRLYLAKTPKELHLSNGMFAARRKAAVLNDLINCAFDHLIEHKLAELATTEYVHYTLWGLAGTWVLLKCFFNLSTEPPSLKHEFEDRIFVHHMTGEASPGFHVYQFYEYREPGQHWSERQKTERLFVNARESPPL